MDNYNFLTFYNITKIYSNTILLTKDNTISYNQWFPFQLQKMCELLSIEYIDPITNHIYNNEILGAKLKKNLSNKLKIKIDKKDYDYEDMVNYGFIKYNSKPNFNIYLSDSKTRILFNINT